jgi:hypothetical protein
MKKERQEAGMMSISDKDLLEVSGGSAGDFRRGISRNDVVSYMQVLAERPGIIDRLEANSLTDADNDSIEKHFPSEPRFIRAAQFAHGRSIEELKAIALMKN